MVDGETQGIVGKPVAGLGFSGGLVPQKGIYGFGGALIPQKGLSDFNTITQKGLYDHKGGYIPSKAIYDTKTQSFIEPEGPHSLRIPETYDSRHPHRVEGKGRSSAGFMYSGYWCK